MRLPQFLPEEEQAELLLDWYRRNRSWILSGIFLLLAVPTGWQFASSQLSASRDADMAAVRTLLEELAEIAQAGAVSELPAEGTTDGVDPVARGAVLRRGLALADELDDRRLQAQVQTILGVEFFRGGDRVAAEAALRQAVETAGGWNVPGEIGDMARVQLGRVLLQGGDLAGARQALSQVASEHLLGERWELEGDLHAASGNMAAARQTWQRALDQVGGPEASFTGRILHLKLTSWAILDGPVGDGTEADDEDWDLDAPADGAAESGGGTGDRGAGDEG